MGYVERNRRRPLKPLPPLPPPTPAPVDEPPPLVARTYANTGAPGIANTKDEAAARLKYLYDLKLQWLRHMIIDLKRTDILAREILGYYVAPRLHMKMIKWLWTHDEALILCFRGAGKTTICTIAMAIHQIILNRNIRILIASKSGLNAQKMLKDIKGHLANNQLLIDCFGPFVGSLWNEDAIEVAGRTVQHMEPTIATVGIESAVVSQHYDIIIGDDLEDRDNVATEHMQTKLKNWYYTNLDPCDAGPGSKRWIIGTTYSPDGLMEHLRENEYEKCCLVVPALDEDGRSPWEERYPADWFAEKRRRAGPVIFAAQYMLDTKPMRGKIFRPEHMNYNSKPPAGLEVYMGVDLAISETDAANKFVIGVIGLDRSTLHWWVVDYFEGKLSFYEQTQKIAEYGKRWKPIKIGIDAESYQASQAQELVRQHPELHIRPLRTRKNKLIRAFKLAAEFEEGKVHLQPGQEIVADRLLRFPAIDDTMDALSFARRVSRVRAAAGNRRRSGVI